VLEFQVNETLCTTGAGIAAALKFKFATDALFMDTGAEDGVNA
jgi:hypothetical protein